MKKHEVLTNITRGGVSVVIPIYNAERTICECLKSVINQSYQELQIICVNDGSTDNSLALLNEFAETDNRIIVIDHPNRGVSSARNTGMNAADREYITFVDSDDTIDSRMYEKMVGELKSFSADLICCNYYLHKEDGTIQSRDIPIKNNLLSGRDSIMENIVRPMLRFSNGMTTGFASVWNKIFNLSLIRKHNIQFDEDRWYGEDWKFCLEYYSYIKSIFFIHEYLYNYINQNPTSQITRFRDDYLEWALNNRKIFRKLFPELEWDTKDSIKYYLNAPIRAAHYYRLYRRGEDLDYKMKQIHNICFSDELYVQYAKKIGGIYKVALSNSSFFLCIVYIITTSKILMCKLLKIIKLVRKAIKQHSHAL